MWYVIPHEVPMDKSVSLEMEKKVQDKWDFDPFCGDC